MSAEMTVIALNVHVVDALGDALVRRDGVHTSASVLPIRPEVADEFALRAPTLDNNPQEMAQG